MQVESSKSEEVTQPAPGAPITIWGIAGPTNRIRHFCLQIHNLLEKLVQEQVEPSKSKKVMFHEYFAFYSLIRKYKKMGPPDLECPQKSAPGDI